MHPLHKSIAQPPSHDPTDRDLEGRADVDALGELEALGLTLARLEGEDPVDALAVRVGNTFRLTDADLLRVPEAEVGVVEGRGDEGPAVRRRPTC
jgi:hypothetical protein